MVGTPLVNPYTQFSLYQKIRRPEKKLRSPWSIRCERKPRRCSLPPRFPPRAECAQFHRAATSSKLVVKFHRWQAEHGTQKTKKYQAQRKVACENPGSARTFLHRQGWRITRRPDRRGSFPNRFE